MAIQEIEEVVDLIILLFSVSDCSIDGTIRLDKMIQMLHNLDRFPAVFKDRAKLPPYGPFNESLLEDLQALEEVGLIRYHDKKWYPYPHLKNMQRMYKFSSSQILQVMLVRMMFGYLELDLLFRMMYFGTPIEVG